MVKKCTNWSEIKGVCDDQATKATHLELPRRRLRSISSSLSSTRFSGLRAKGDQQGLPKGKLHDDTDSDWSDLDAEELQVCGVWDLGSGIVLRS